MPLRFFLFFDYIYNFCCYLPDYQIKSIDILAIVNGFHVFCNS